jgi:hypothetical protein
MARPRKPTNVLKLNGTQNRNPGRLKEREGEPDNIAPLGDPPIELTDEESDCWRELADISIPGVLGKADRIAVEMAAKLLVRLRSGEAPQAEQGLFFKYLSQFGMLPADRSKIALNPKKPKNRFDEG